MKKIILGVVILFLIIVLILGFFYASKPDKFSEKEKEEAIAQILGRKANTDPEIKTGNGSYEGKLIKFSYPAAAEEYKYRGEDMKNNTDEAENFSFDLKSPRLVLNYTASATKETKIEDESAVKFRDNPSSGYTKSQEKINGLTGFSYKKDRSGEFNAEKSTFIINNGYLYTFSISGSSLEDIEKLHKQIIGSVVFK